MGGSGSGSEWGGGGQAVSGGSVSGSEWGGLGQAVSGGAGSVGSTKLMLTTLLIECC